MPVWPLPADELVAVVNGRCAGDVSGLAIEAASVGDITPAAGQIFVPVQEDVDGHDYVERALTSGVSLALVARSWGGIADLAPELAERCVIVDDVLTAYRLLAAHLRSRFTFPVIAVAGSCGKTTTKELIAALLADAGLDVSKTPQTMNGFSGIPFTLCQSQHRQGAPPDALVVEIGIDAIGAMAEHARIVRPDVAVITALGAEHLDGLESVATAAQEERALFDFAQQAVAFDALGELSFSVARATPRSIEVQLSLGAIEGVITLPVGGAHNAHNLACAVAAVLATELVEPEVLLRTRRLAFAAPSQRCQIRQLRSGVTLVDDCYNASPASMRAALTLIADPAWRHRHKTLVLGDMLELGDETAALHAELAALWRGAGELVLIGDAMRAVAGDDATWFPADASAAEICAAVPEEGVVLVKGSRGLRLERVTTALAERPQRSREIAIAVVGAERDPMAEEIAAALGRADAGDVVALDAMALSQSPRATRAAVFTGFVREDVAPPEGVSAEEFQLALMAQPFMHLAPEALAVLVAGDEATPVLAAAIPAHAETVVLPRDEIVTFFEEVRDDPDRAPSLPPDTSTENRS